MVRSRNYVAAFIKSFYKRSDMSMLELTPDFIKEFSVFLTTEQGFRVAGLHVGQDGRFTGALQRSDTEKSVCSVPYHAQREGKGVSYGGRNPAAYRA